MCSQIALWWLGCIHESRMALADLVIPEIYQNLDLLNVAHNDSKGVTSCVSQFCKLWATLVCDEYKSSHAVRAIYSLLIVCSTGLPMAAAFITCHQC